MAGAPLIVFDLDGTLVDTAPDLVATLNVILAGENLPPVSFEIARNMVGGGARVMLERGLTAAGAACPPGKLDQMEQDFIAHYAAHIADASRPFPDVEAALDQLRERGCRLAVCTNKLAWLSLRLLEALGLVGRFSAVCGPDTFGMAKPNPEILHRTIARAGAETASVVMVGDSITDVATARAAAIPVIAVDFGYSETPVSRLSPDGVISRFTDLPDAIFDLLGCPAGFRQDG
jgi:phosphoglycolate phosphatase